MASSKKEELRAPYTHTHTHTHPSGASSWEHTGFLREQRPHHTLENTQSIKQKDPHADRQHLPLQNDGSVSIFLPSFYSSRRETRHPIRPLSQPLFCPRSFPLISSHNQPLFSSFCEHIKYPLRHSYLVPIRLNIYICCVHKDSSMCIRTHSHSHMVGDIFSLWPASSTTLED